MSESRRRVFVSYASSDREFADRLTDALSESGVIAFDPAKEIAVGKNVEDAIFDELKASDLVVFVVPEREGAGKNALAELGAAYALGKRIVAVAPDTGRLYNSDVARRLSHSSVIDASKLPDKAKLADVILTPLAA